MGDVTYRFDNVVFTQNLLTALTQFREVLELPPEFHAARHAHNHQVGALYENGADTMAVTFGKEYLTFHALSLRGNVLRIALVSILMRAKGPPPEIGFKTVVFLEGDYAAGIAQVRDTLPVEFAFQPTDDETGARDALQGGGVRSYREGRPG